MGLPTDSKTILPSQSDAGRVAALRGYQVLDTPAELEYDQIVATVKRVFDVPIAVISLVDENRQWFKSKIGIDACETCRDISFCTHTIVETAPLVIENSLDDPRFCENPLVLGPPFVRFYAGAPLIDSNGYCLGAVCAIDTVPRRVTKRQVDLLETAARLVMKFLEARTVVEEPFRYGSSLAELSRRFEIPA